MGVDKGGSNRDVVRPSVSNSAYRPIAFFFHFVNLAYGPVAQVRRFDDSDTTIDTPAPFAALVIIITRCTCCSR